MRQLLLYTLICISVQTAIARDYILYDPVNDDELVFTATSRYEELAIDELDPINKIGYTYFTFSDETYEQARLSSLYHRFKKRPLEASFKAKVEPLIERYYKTVLANNPYYRGQLEYAGYRVSDMGLRPLSFLGNTLTFSYSVEIRLNKLSEEAFNFEEIFYLDLSDFSIMEEEEIHQFINHDALRKAMRKEWKEILNEIPVRNFSPVDEDDVELPYDEYYEDEEDENQTPKPIFTDSLITWIINEADLARARIYFTGAGLMVYLNEPVPELKTIEPINFQLHLDLYKTGKALQGFEPYRDLQKPEPYDAPVLVVDPCDVGREASFANLYQHHLNFLHLDDPSISSIERYVKNNPEDSQYIHQIIYDQGYAKFVDGRANTNRPFYDSIFWKDGKVHTMISRRTERDYNDDRGYVEVQHIRIQPRDERGNTLWFLDLQQSMNMRNFTYFEGKVASYNYTLLSNDFRSLNQRNPQWYTILDDGLCTDEGHCVRVDDEGRLDVFFKDYYVYRDGKLVQILGDRDNYTLLYYEDSRLMRTERGPNSSETVKYFYQEGDELPYRIEEWRENYPQPRSFYQIIHRE